MIRRAQEMKSEIRSQMRGGVGDNIVTNIMEESEFLGHGRLFANITLKPGNSIGFHKHEGDFETYYIAHGEGILDDNGTKTPIKAGDMSYTKNGESHSIENTGKEDMLIIALVLFDK